MLFEINYKPLSLSRFIVAIGLMVFSFSSFAQTSDELKAEIKAFQVEQDEHYLNKKTSPLSKKERKAFQGHSFYSIDLKYVVEAEFLYIEREDTVEMSTSSGNTKYYRPYAILK